MTYRPISITKMRAPAEVDAGSAPQLSWLSISDLVVDDDYQRDLKTGNIKAIQRIAAAFTWSKFSPVFVAPVEGGRYAIIDGQHRTHAAALCGFEQVPCQVVQMDKAEQAAAFTAVNGMVTKVTTWQIFKAALTAGETWAVEAAACAEAGGCRLMTSNTTTTAKKPGEIYAIVRFRDCLKRFGAERLSAVLRCLMSVEMYMQAPQLWDNTLLFPMLNALGQRPHVLTGHVDQLGQLDIWYIEDKVKQEARVRARNGQPAISKRDRMETEVLDWLDKHCPRRMALPSVKGACDGG